MGFLAWKEFFHCIWFPRSPSRQPIIWYWIAVFLVPTLPLRSRFSLVPSLCIAIHSPHVLPKDLVLQTAFKLKGRRPGWGPGARCGWSCFAFHVKYWLVDAAEGRALKPDVTSRKAGHHRHLTTSIWYEAGCHVGFLQASLFSLSMVS